MDLWGYARRFVEHSEGRRNKVYRDSRGIPTVGVGFNLHRSDAQKRLALAGLDLAEVLSGKALTNHQVDLIFNVDLQSAIDFTRTLFGLDGFTMARQVVLVDLAFNLGVTRFLGFKKMIAAVRAEDWSRAADEMVSSMWFHQVGSRGPRNVEAMRSGVIPAGIIPELGAGAKAGNVPSLDEERPAVPQPGIQSSAERGPVLVRPALPEPDGQDGPEAGRESTADAQAPRRMEVVYVAGPYRSKDGMFGVKRNIDLAIDVARALWLAGYVALCPHANSYMMDGPDIPAETFLRGDLELVRRSDSVCLLPGWEKSEGTRGEATLALAMGKPFWRPTGGQPFPYGFIPMPDSQVRDALNGHG